MNDAVLAAAWYRFGATFRRRRGSYVAIVLLIALMGGIAMGSIAGARRTQSAFSAYLAATKASDLQFQTSIASYGFVDENLTKKLEQLPGVERVASAPNLLVSPSERNGKVILSAFNDADVQAVGSVGGMFFSNDRVTVAAGVMADPNSTKQIVATAEAARQNGWHVGETVYFDGYSVQQASSTTFNPLQAKPTIRFAATLTGLVVFSSQVVNDDVDRFPTDVLMTPALTRRLAAEGTYPTYGLRLKGGSNSVPRVERGDHRRAPSRSTYNFHLTSVEVGEVERATKPEAIALGTFGAIAALAALLIAVQAISRALWSNDEDLDVLARHRR